MTKELSQEELAELANNTREESIEDVIGVHTDVDKEYEDAKAEIKEAVHKALHTTKKIVTDERVIGLGLILVGIVAAVGAHEYKKNRD